MFWIVSSVTKFSLQVKLQIQNLQSRSQFFTGILTVKRTRYLNVPDWTRHRNNLLQCKSILYLIILSETSKG